MKRRLIRSVSAAVMTAAIAVGLAGPATAQPAQPAVDPGTVIAIVKQIYSIYQQFAGGSGGLTLPQAVQQIEDKIQSAQTAIVQQIDLVAAANVQACASSAVINFADINALSPDNLQVFALNTTDCVTQANSLLGAVTDKTAIDRIGIAMNTVGPLALMARIKAGLTTPALKSVLTAGDNTLISALLPTCRRLNEGDPDHPFFEYDCIAYNGDEGEVPVSVANYKVLAQDAATGNTSRAIAQAALPTLA
jgi:hypothetical protein